MVLCWNNSNSSFFHTQQLPAKAEGIRSYAGIPAIAISSSFLYATASSKPEGI